MTDRYELVKREQPVGDSLLPFFVVEREGGMEIELPAVVSMLDRQADEIDRLRTIIDNIEQIRTGQGNTLEIFNDNEDEFDVERQSAVDVMADFTDWGTVRYWGKTWTEALAKAAEASRDHDRVFKEGGR